MSHPAKHLWLVPLVALMVLALPGAAQAGSIALGYDGAGVYPQRASANSERYFRVIATWTPASESLASLTISGVSGQTTLVPGAGAAQGVASYVISSGTTMVVAYTIGPYAGFDIFGAPHAGVVGNIGNSDTGSPFTFTAVFVTSSGATAVSATGTHYTQYDNADLLQWFSGQATGVDPLGVDGPDITADNGAGSSRYTFRVQYKILEGYAQNLLPRFSTEVPPPGGQVATFVDMDAGLSSPSVAFDRIWDRWTYSPYQNDFGDRTGYVINYQVPEVVLIIDGDRARPHFMVRDDAADSNAQDANGIRYRYEVLPTDYENFMDNIFLFSYDPPGTDAWDAYASGLDGRPVSNSYVAMTAGGHRYEFLASDDFSSPNQNRTWTQVGWPGNAHHNDYIRSVPFAGGPVTTTRAFTRFTDSDGGAGGYGYPYDSQDTTRYPDVNPVLSAHPYFPTGTIAPGNAGGSLGPNVPGAAPNPFPAEVGAGPNPPQRFTNDDTILPNLVNIRPNSDPVPFRGGKWTGASTYTFRINYWQSNNVAPQFVRLQVRRNDDGAAPGAYRSYTMEKLDSADTDHSNGCVYQYQLTPDQLPSSGGPGDYNYQFQASDGIRTTSFPNRPVRAQLADPSDIGVPISDTNDYYAFRVNHAPVLSNQAVDPVSGRAGDNFRFSVTYTDVDGEMLNTTSRGDRPFETSLFVDLFGSPEGQARVNVVQSETALTYTVADGDGYDNDTLVNHFIEVQTGLAAGRTYRIIANTLTTITVVAGSTMSTDGVRAADLFRIANWFKGTMAELDAVDTNYADGKVYFFDSATNIVMGPGVHRYYFVYRDDWGSWLYPDDSNVMVEGERIRYPLTGSFEGPELLPNTAPILTNYRFTPDAATGPDGTTATGFVFSVTYRDNENNPPALIRLGIDGTDDAPDTILNLAPANPGDNVYTDGAIYNTPAVRLAEGTHIFRAQASDGTGRFPPTPVSLPLEFSGPPVDWPNDPYGPRLGSVPGPEVARNTPPQLSFPANDDGSDPANPPGLDPNTGRTTTEFTYTIIYTDTDRFAGVAGNPPDYVRVFIDNVQHDMTKVTASDNDYTDGATYVFKITGLVEGTPHRYYFAASDGLDRDRLPNFNASPNFFNGPIVDEPPGRPLSLLAQDTPNDNGGNIDLTWNPSPDDGSGANDVTEYRVYRKTSGGGQYLVTDRIASLGATGAPAYSYRDSSAVTGTQYWYIVRAFDVANESLDSNEAGPVTAIDNIRPLPPTSVAVANPGLGGTLDVTWSLSPDDGRGQNDVREYRIFRSTTTSFAPPHIGTAPAGTGNFRDSTATDGTAYFYMVRSFDGANESDDSNTAGPETPTDEQPPVIANLSPADRALDVPIDAPISFTVTDTGSGVDRTTLTVEARIGGTPIDIGTPTITGNTQAITVRHQPAEPFPYRAVVVVEVHVSDNGGQAASKIWRFTVTGPPTYTISGRVTLADTTGLAGVVVSAGALSATTDATGNYTIVGLADGTYNVRPVLRGWAFAPEQTSVTVPPSATGVDFVAQPGFDIAGRVNDENRQPMEGVTVSDGIHSSVTDDLGRWRLKDLPAGTYNIVPSKSGFVFDPPARLVTLVDALVVGQDFVGRLQTFSISGTISDINGNRVEAATVRATLGSTELEAVTNASGQYVLSNLLPGRWVLEPRKAGYDFEPSTRTVDLSGDAANVDFVAVPIYALDLAAGLSMVAVPVDPRDDNPVNAFGAASVVARWDPQATPPQYRVMDSSSASVPSVMRLAPGRGFWVRVPVGTTARVAGTPTLNNQPTSLQLFDGWNMAGNPYDADLPWSNVGVVAGGPVRDFAFIYDPSTRGYVLVTQTPGVSPLTSVPKNAGMWMRAVGQRTVAISPVSTTAQKRTTYVAAAGDFVVPIVAEAGGSVDATARVGIMGFAKENPEAYAIDNPPAIKPYVDVYFPATDNRRLACDIRGEGVGTLGYTFVVNTDMVNTNVKVSLPDLSQVGKDKGVTLVDVASGKRLYARTVPSYSYNSGDGGAREFRLEIGPATAAGNLVIGAAAAQETAAGLGISYTLSRDARVEITVMNLSGRAVRVVNTSGLATAGINQATWDLRGTSGTKVPAGRYLLRIQAVADDGQQVNVVVPANVTR